MQKKVKDLIVNPAYANAVRDLSNDEYTSLFESIKEEGVLFELLINHLNEVIDGHHRRKIAIELEIDMVPIKFIEIRDEKEGEKYAVVSNLVRRQLSTKERTDLGVFLFRKKREESGKRSGGSKSLEKSNVPNGTNEISSKPGSYKDSLLMRFKTDINPKATEPEGELAEEVAKTVGVSKRTLYRGIDKDAIQRGEKEVPKKEFVEKDKINICLVFFRVTTDHWDLFNVYFRSRKEAEEYVNTRKNEGSVFYGREAAYHNTEISFFNTLDKKIWERWSDE